VGVRAPPIKVKRRGYYATHGRNGMWILDQNEKLGIFGFKILACIDGFSRYPIWWKVTCLCFNDCPDELNKFSLVSCSRTFVGQRIVLFLLTASELRQLHQRMSLLTGRLLGTV
jgi:hypothetical protein